MVLTEILAVDAVHYAQSETSKKRLLQKISEQAASAYGLDSAVVFSALNARELLGTTGVGRGVAIPHARFEDLDRVIGLLPVWKNHLIMALWTSNPLILFSHCWHHKKKVQSI